MSTVDNVAAETEENVELPDDFFDEFEDSKFLDEIVEIVAPEQPRSSRTEDVHDSSRETSKSSSDPPDEQEPLLKRCLTEINNLEKSIERRKRRLRNENTKSDNDKRKNRRSHSPPGRPDRNTRSRDHRLSPARRSPSGSRSRRVRSRSRERNRSRDRPDRRLSRNRRDRSRSDSPVNQPRNMSFLEELERKFAEKGQDFPEKDLFIKLRATQNGMNSYPATVGYPQCDMSMPMPPYIRMPSMHMPMYSQPFQGQWNGNYMMDSMTSMQQTMLPIPIPSPCVNGTTLNGNSASKTIVREPPSNKAEVVARCRAASKILRSEENKVPKLRFLFTRTSMPIGASEEQTPPLQSRKNVEFEQTSDNKKPFAPLQFLPVRTRELVKILGYDCSAILNRLRLKEFADKVIHEIDADKKRSKERTYKDGEMQTESYKCPTCIDRESKRFSNQTMQTDAPKKVSIRTQTNEKDYRDPLIRSLTRLTAGQLVAVSDFVDLICAPRPSTSTEVFSVREKLMDIYNLSERGTDAIEAERTREHESRRRGLNNSSMASPPLEDLRATIRGTSDHNMGRIPPPPPLLMNYQMEIGMIEAAEQEERENRLQQLRYEENLRLQLQDQRQREQEQRQREWEMQQLFLQQQRQLQLQREQEEENARLEMRNERFGRGNQWNGARGHGRY